MFFRLLLITTLMMTSLMPLPQAEAVAMPQQLLSPTLATKPIILQGLKVFADKPFKMDFLIDPGEKIKTLSSPNASVPSNRVFPKVIGDLQQEQLTRLIKYFLAGLTIPNGDLWVNLSPYEKNRIIPESFGQTAMGVDVLSQDYILKQLTASLIYPESESGKLFWQKVYAQAQQKFGTTNIPINTFNKVWIVPEEAVVYENIMSSPNVFPPKADQPLVEIGDPNKNSQSTAYIAKAKLKVMLEEDYMAQSKNELLTRGHVQDRTAENVSPSTMPSELASKVKASQGNPDSQAIGSQIIREVIIPILEREVNEGAHFTQLRQVYHALILATWYKKKIKQSLIAKAYVDQKKVGGLKDNVIVRSEATKQSDIESIYQQYIQTFKKGVYNYIKEDSLPLEGRAREGATGTTIPRKYFAGGAGFNLLYAVMKTEVVDQLPDTMSSQSMSVAHADFAMNAGISLEAQAVIKDMKYKDHEIASKIHGVQQGLNLLKSKRVFSAQILASWMTAVKMLQEKCDELKSYRSLAEQDYARAEEGYAKGLRDIVRMIEVLEIAINAVDQDEELLKMIQANLKQVREFIISIRDFTKPYKKLISLELLLKEIETEDLVKIKINPSTGLMINVDELHILTVLRNLIGNAQRSIRDAHIADGKISIDVGQEGDQVRITVADNGLGMLEENVRRFGNQENLLSDQQGEGHGIGTQIIRTIIKAHGGEIRVESRELSKGHSTDHGTTFTILLPASPAMNAVPDNLQEITKVIDEVQYSFKIADLKPTGLLMRGISFSSYRDTQEPFRIYQFIRTKGLMSENERGTSNNMQGVAKALNFQAPGHVAFSLTPDFMFSSSALHYFGVGEEAVTFILKPDYVKDHPQQWEFVGNFMSGEGDGMEKIFQQGLLMHGVDILKEAVLAVLKKQSVIKADGRVSLIGAFTDEIRSTKAVPPEAIMAIVVRPAMLKQVLAWDKELKMAHWPIYVRPEDLGVKRDSTFLYQLQELEENKVLGFEDIKSFIRSGAVKGKTFEIYFDSGRPTLRITGEMPGAGKFDDIGKPPSELREGYSLAGLKSLANIGTINALGITGWREKPILIIGSGNHWMEPKEYLDSKSVTLVDVLEPDLDNILAGLDEINQWEARQREKLVIHRGSLLQFNGDQKYGVIQAEMVLSEGDIFTKEQLVLAIEKVKRALIPNGYLVSTYVSGKDMYEAGFKNTSELSVWQKNAAMTALPENNVESLEQFIARVRRVALEGKMFDISFNDAGNPELTVKGDMPLADWFNETPQDVGERAKRTGFALSSTGGVESLLEDLILNKDEALNKGPVLLIGPGDHWSELKYFLNKTLINPIVIIEPDLNNVINGVKMISALPLEERMCCLIRRMRAEDMVEQEKYGIIYSMMVFSADMSHENGTLEKVERALKVGGVLSGHSREDVPRGFDYYSDFDKERPGEKTQIFRKVSPAMTTAVADKGETIHGREVVRLINSKWGMRSILKGGKIRQPDWFVIFKSDEYLINEMSQGEMVGNLASNLKMVNPDRVKDFKAIANDIVEGRVQLPVVYKPNSGALGDRVFFIERQEKKQLLVTFAFTQTSYLEANYQQRVIDYMSSQGIKASISLGENIMQFVMGGTAKQQEDVLLGLWHVVSFSPLDNAYDTGGMESFIQALTIEGKAVETRFIFRGNLNTGEFSPAYNDPEQNDSWLHDTRIGSSKYFANMAGRLSAGKKMRFDADLFVLESFGIKSNRLKEFRTYVDALIEQDFKLLVSRLKKASFNINEDIRGEVDFKWQAPQKEGEFPVPVLVEANLKFYPSSFLNQRIKFLKSFDGRWENLDAAMASGEAEVFDSFDALKEYLRSAAVKKKTFEIRFDGDKPTLRIIGDMPDAGNFDRVGKSTRA